MIISHKHKFIFLKTRKTASTSTEFALNEICGPDDVVTPVGVIDETKRTGRGRGTINTAHLCCPPSGRTWSADMYGMVRCRSTSMGICTAGALNGA
jgi:hypothetical protein